MNAAKALSPASRLAPLVGRSKSSIAHFPGPAGASLQELHHQLQHLVRTFLIGDVARVDLDESRVGEIQGEPTAQRYRKRPVGGPPKEQGRCVDRLETRLELRGIPGNDVPKD